MPAFVLHAATPIMRCLGILDEEAKGALSSLFAVASDDFKRSYSGGYVVPYAKMGTPSAAAQDMDMAEKLWVFTNEEFGKKGLL